MNHCFTIHGTRGTMPAAGRQFARYGTPTTCFSLQTPQGLIVLDAGTGIAALSDRLKPQTALPPITLLFTHFHLDHVIGLPSFQPIYRRQARITIMADRGAGGTAPSIGRGVTRPSTPANPIGGPTSTSAAPGRSDNWRHALQTLVAPPFWPVKLAQSRARLRLEDLPTDRAVMFRHGARIAWCPVRHPQQCLAYRLECAGKSIVIATDHEIGDPRLDRRFLQFCGGADVLIIDAQYTPREKAAHIGWGHGTWREAAAIARAAGVGELILTHHDRQRTDAQIDAIVRQARRYFPRTRAAQAGLRL